MSCCARRLRAADQSLAGSGSSGAAAGLLASIFFAASRMSPCMPKAARFGSGIPAGKGLSAPLASIRFSRKLPHSWKGRSDVRGGPA